MARRLWILAMASVLGLAAPSPSHADDAKGFKDILDGIEKGKRFHSLWPPVAGSALGQTVVANKPKSIGATFESINSPTFRNPAYDGTFDSGEVVYVAPEVTGEKKLKLDVAIPELDSLLGKRVKNGTAGTAEGGEDKAAISWEGLTEVKRATRKVSVQYYLYKTLTDIYAGTAVNPVAKQFLSEAGRGWILHRVLMIQGLDYTLTANKDFTLDFLSKLVAWLPGVDVHYVSKRTIKLVSEQPISIGYKLWRPGIQPEGAAVADVDVHQLGLDADAIDKAYSTAP